MEPRVCIIVAMDRKRVIGKDNRLPWHISEDLKHFKALTMGHPIIMGRKTFESIGRVLPGRLNIVVTRQSNYSAPAEVCVASSIAAALDAAKDANEMFIIGGHGLYINTLERAWRLYVTEVDGEFDGDTFFPEVDHALWQEVARDHRPLAGDGYRGYAFVTYDRITGDT